MIVAKAPDAQLFYFAEELYRTPRSNFYARLNAVVGVWRELCAPLASAFSPERNGRPTDHVVYFKIFLVGYMENITSDTALAERVADSIAIREFIGFGPGEKTPDHSRLGPVRERFTRCGGLEKVMDAVVMKCVEAGLVSGEEVAADSTLIPANASLASLVSIKTGVTISEHFEQLRQENKKPTVSNDEFRSTSDPDARIAKKGTNCPRGMYHKVTHVTDSASQVILSAKVATADIGDPEAVAVPLGEAKQRLKDNQLTLGLVVCDAGYDDSSFHAFVEGMEATPLTNYTESQSPKPEGYAKKDFVYDAEQDLYICPNGKILKRQCSEGDRVLYQALQTDCAGCPFKDLCLSKDKKQRSIRRAKNEAARERNIARCHTDEARAALSRRKIIVEPPIADLKCHGGLAKMNCRGTKNAQVKITIAAIGWNLKKLVKKAGKGLLSTIFGSIWTRISEILQLKVPVYGNTLATTSR
jgi:transposase